ncbi:MULTISPECIES: hypothetical protein, partial [unclassified Microcoleus]|uniref:hypothetical protein n=1 Tax=unclassified Microcoleus TaxID=2642155 RepID=UPI002FCFC139
TYSRLHINYSLSIPDFGSFFPWITLIGVVMNDSLGLHTIRRRKLTLSGVKPARKASMEI